MRVATGGYGEFVPGDMRHSAADISKAERLLDYPPQYDIAAAMKQSLPYYLQRSREG